MLNQQGWSRIVILALPSSVISKTQVAKSATRFILPDSSESAIVQTLNSIKQKFGRIGAFIHLHPVFHKSLTLDSAFPEPETEIVRLIYFLAKHLKPDLMDSSQDARSWFMALTRMNGRLGLGDPMGASVLAGGLYGLIKTINIEWEPVFCRSVDFEVEADDDTISRALEFEMLDPDSRLTEVGHSSSGRVTLTADIDNIEVPETGSEVSDSGSVFLVAGGARGVTATCIKEMARRFRANFILLGRSDNSMEEPDWCRGITDDAELKKRCMEAFLAEGEKPTPVKIANRLKPIMAQREVNSTIRDLQSHGSKAVYLSSDILDANAIKKKLVPITKELGAVTGIIHGAGVLADKLIEEKTEQDFQSVFATKIEGLQSLLQCVSPERLQHLILFSSAAGFYGNEAQSDYAAANEILNKFAHLFKQTVPSCHVISFNWGPWDGGMVTAQLKRMFEERNIRVIPPEVGSAIMSDELASTEQSSVQLVVGSSMIIPRKLDTVLRSYHLTRSLNLAKNPFLNHHVIGKEPVLPIICALGWMAESCEMLYPGYRFSGSQDTKVLKGVVLHPTETRTFTINIDELEKAGTDRIVFQVTVVSGNPEKPVFHYRSKIWLTNRMPQAAKLESIDLTPAKEKKGAEYYTDGTLFHGPLFQSVRNRLNLNSRQLTLACQSGLVSQAEQGQFQASTFNPFADDVQLQGLLIWVRDRFQAASLPLSIGEGRFFRKTPFDQPFYVSMKVDSASATKLIATVSTHDETGLIYSQLKGAEVIISKSLNQKFLENSLK